jgi:hypothetical protein
VSGPGAVNPYPSVGPAGPGAQAPAPTPAAPSGVLGPGATQGPQ